MRSKLVRLFLLSYSSLIWPQSHHPGDFLERITGSKDEGAQIVAHYCASCHAVKPLIPLGAPRTGVVAEWKGRLAPGLTLLLRHVDEGLGNMPARGGCFECSDEQLFLAILEMVPEPLRNDLIKEHKNNK